MLLVALPAQAAAQRAAVTELSAVALTTVARRDLAALGFSVAHRPGQARVTLLVVGGVLDGHAATRAEVTAQFLVNPSARAGVSAYGALGIAVVSAAQVRGGGYITMFFGVERAAARRGGWFVEAGLGGGVRVAAGARWRRPR